MLLLDDIATVLDDVSVMTKVAAKKEFSITIALHLGRHAATVYSCDCTEEYVKINK